MLLKTVEYEIPKDGDCSKCKSRCFVVHAYYNGEKCDIHFCRAFGSSFHWFSQEKIEQCQMCKDFIKEQTQCMKCIHQGDYSDWECNIGNDPKTCEEWSE